MILNDSYFNAYEVKEIYCEAKQLVCFNSQQKATMIKNTTYKSIYSLTLKTKIIN